MRVNRRVGKDRVFNRRFQNLASHPCSSRSPAPLRQVGRRDRWNQVGVVRHRFFVKRRRVTSLEELNEWLEGEGRNHAVTAKHPALCAEEKSRSGIRPWHPIKSAAFRAVAAKTSTAKVESPFWPQTLAFYKISY